MGFLKKMVSMFGIGRDEAEDDDDHHQNDAVPPGMMPAHNVPRKGFSIPVQVAPDKPLPGPILVPCTTSNGGVQGFKWYAKRLTVDEDGDVADEFIVEASPDKAEGHHKAPHRFEVKSNTRSAKVSNLARSQNGKIQMYVASQGRLEWL